MTKKLSLRQKIEQSERLADVLAWFAGAYLALCNRTTRWHIEGRDDLRAAIDKGPILILMWHERSVLGALHWPATNGPLSSLYDSSPIGRVSGALQRRAGLQSMQMSRKTSNLAASRIVLKRVREGVSIGMTGDGPLGPARQMKDAPIEWARVTGMPVFCYAFATSRGRRLKTWDKMVLPRMFGQGAIVFARFDKDIPRKMPEAAQDALREDLRVFMDATTARADVLVSR
ncbi:lysophospholipid acyltransferase family protein [Yoonia sp.]|uniref:lysophospholipid acyltransferase family protein n=1 Tax=Yoonia sp. TaxID=2212373 RepID=UPI003A4D7E72